MQDAIENNPESTSDQHDEQQAPERPEPSKADLKRAKQLRTLIADLAADLESIYTKIDDAQSELSALNIDDESSSDSFEIDTISTLRTELEEAKGNHQRVLADFKNFQRRASENELRARDAGRASVLESFVAVLDTFDLAMKMDPETTPAAGILEGVKMIRGEAIRNLSTHGFRSLEPTPNTPYDPNAHEAISNEPNTDIDPGNIVSLHQPGYALNDRVLRPAKVTVNPADADANSNEA